MDLKKLGEKFNPLDLEWRLQQSGISKDGKPWALALCYVTSRAIMDRLDEVCGPENWKNRFAPGPDGGIICGIAIKIGDEWVEKWDGAEKTQIEAVKGGLSGAMKRAGVQWRIGRYLYKLPTTFAKCSLDTNEYENKAKTRDGKRFSWATPTLPKWAVPGGDGKPAKKAAKKQAPEPWGKHEWLNDGQRTEFVDAVSTIVVTDGELPEFETFLVKQMNAAITASNGTAKPVMSQKFIEHAMPKLKEYYNEFTTE